MNSEFAFNHNKSQSSFRDKNLPSYSTSSSNSGTHMAFGPSYLFLNHDFRAEAAIRYVLHKGGSSPFLSGYYEDLKLTGADFKLKLAKFHSLTDSVALGTGIDIQYLFGAKAKVSEYSSTVREIEVDDISYVSTTWYPIKVQLKF